MRNIKILASALAIAALVWAISSAVSAFTGTGPNVAALSDDEDDCQVGNASHQNSDSHCVKPTPTPRPSTRGIAISINTTTGPCVASGGAGCGAAVYTASGFSGVVSYDNPGSTSRLAAFLCGHTPRSGGFVSLGGGYTLTARSSGGALLATSSYSVTGDVDCTGDADPVSGSVHSFTVPADGSVSYSVMVAGLTVSRCPTSLSAYNSIRNQVFDRASDAHAASPSVAPCGAPPLVPEAPFSALLVATAGLGSLIFVARRLGFDLIGPLFSRSRAIRGL